MLQSYDSLGGLGTTDELRLHIYPDDAESRQHTEWLVEEVLRNTQFPHPEQTYVRVKVYEPTYHGVRGAEMMFDIPAYPPSDYFGNVLQRYAAYHHQYPRITEPCIGLGSSFTDQVTGINYELQMIDLEIDATGNAEKDLAEISERLIQNGVAGMFLRSGDPGENMGSYHFIGDRLYRINLHEMIGLIMTSLSIERTENGDAAIALGKALLEVKLGGSIRDIAQAIKRKFPSISVGKRREGLVYDPRHLAHAILDNGTCVLRATRTRDYTAAPVMVGEIH